MKYCFDKHVALEQKMFENACMYSIWVTLNKGQTMTLTSETHVCLYVSIFSVKSSI